MAQDYWPMSASDVAPVREALDLLQSVLQGNPSAYDLRMFSIWRERGEDKGLKRDGLHVYVIDNMLMHLPFNEDYNDKVRRLRLELADFGSEL